MPAQRQRKPSLAPESLKVDSTDAPYGPQSYPQPTRVWEWTLLTLTVDSTDATPSYPVDSTDEANNRIKYPAISLRQ